MKLTNRSTAPLALLAATLLLATACSDNAGSATDNGNQAAHLDTDLAVIARNLQPLPAAPTGLGSDQPADTSASGGTGSAGTQVTPDYASLGEPDANGCVFLPTEPQTTTELGMTYTTSFAPLPGEAAPRMCIDMTAGTMEFAYVTISESNGIQDGFTVDQQDTLSMAFDANGMSFGIAASGTMTKADFDQSYRLHGDLSISAAQMTGAANGAEVAPSGSFEYQISFLQGAYNAVLNIDAAAAVADAVAGSTDLLDRNGTKVGTLEFDANGGRLLDLQGNVIYQE